MDAVGQDLWQDDTARLDDIDVGFGLLVRSHFVPSSIVIMHGIIHLEEAS